MRIGQVPKYHGKCSKCGGERDSGKRYCRACDATYAREWRKVQRARVLAVVSELERMQGEARVGSEQEKTLEG